MKHLNIQFKKVMEETKTRSQTEVSRASDFVSRVIDSCQHTWHLQGAQRLLQFFKETYYDKHGGKIAHDKLMTQIVDKLPSIVETS